MQEVKGDDGEELVCFAGLRIVLLISLLLLIREMLLSQFCVCSSFFSPSPLCHGRLSLSHGRLPDLLGEGEGCVCGGEICFQCLRGRGVWPLHGLQVGCGP